MTIYPNVNYYFQGARGCGKSHMSFKLFEAIMLAKILNEPVEVDFESQLVKIHADE